MMNTKPIGGILAFIIVFLPSISFENAYSHGFPESLPEKYLIDYFVLKSQNNKIPFIIQNNINHVSGFNLDSNNNLISFKISSELISKHSNAVIVQFYVPKSLVTYTANNEFIGYVNDVSISENALIIDPYSLNDSNLVFFILDNHELERITLSSHNNSKFMQFKLIFPVTNEKLSNYKMEKKSYLQVARLLGTSPENIHCNNDLVLALRTSGEWNCITENTARQMQIRGLIEHYETRNN